MINRFILGSIGKKRGLWMSAMVLALMWATWFFHAVLGIDVLLTHFFYIPIVFASVWWGRRGLVVPVFLGVFLCGVSIFWGQRDFYVTDVLRSLVFIGVGWLVGVLSEEVVRRGRELTFASRELERRVSELDRFYRASFMMGATASPERILGEMATLIPLIDQNAVIGVDIFFEGRLVGSFGAPRSVDCLRSLDIMQQQVCGRVEVTFKQWDDQAVRVMGLLKVLLTRFERIMDKGRIEERLKETDDMLTQRTIALEQKNLDLQELLRQIDEEKKQISERVRANVSHIVLPVLERLRKTRCNKITLNMLQSAIEKLSSPFGKELASVMTDREMEVASMIRLGVATKGIASSLNISISTVETHRNNIRKKLGIADSNIDLKSYLRMI